MSLRCLLVDDSVRFLEAARALLERGGVEVVGIASTGADALSQARETAPDVVLVDLDLDLENGFDVAHRLVGDVPAVILISTHSREDFQELIADSPRTRLPSQVGPVRTGDQRRAGRHRADRAELREPTATGPDHICLMGDRCCRDLVNTLQCGGTRGVNDGVRM
ncbi:response regulator [Streptomyces sp. NBC_01239]|uniref:response regulator n=1 Tax=Streptomyces sp. NBC_01239 TaxID=2903792 RepID=UPI002B1E7BFB|nr:response regulator [Streptomyces sp. NBC_01239]